MKKLLVAIGVVGLIGLSACSKCGECSDQTVVTIIGEYCKGNALEDAFYEAAKEDCEGNGGTWDTK